MAIKKNAPNYLKKTKQPFTTLINKTLDMIPDAAAIGIYVYLASKQDDWIIQEKDLMNRFGAGRDFIRTRMKILKDLGLLIKEAIRDEKGRIVHWETILLNEVTVKPSPKENIHITEKPPSGKPRCLDNPTHINKRYKERNNSIINISTSGEVADLSYTDSDELDENEVKSDYLEDKLNDESNAAQAIVSPNNSAKSDKCDNQPKKETDRETKESYGLKEVLNDNIHDISLQQISDWIANRQKKRIPLTKTAWDKLNKELTKCKERGVDPHEAFETMVASGWQSLKAEYFLNHKPEKPKIDNLSTDWADDVMKPFYEMGV